MPNIEFEQTTTWHEESALPSNQDDVERLRGSARSNQIPRLVLLYIVIASLGFTLVCTLSYFGYQMMAIYESSIADNKKWATRLAMFEGLRLHIGALNVTANKVFATGNVEQESAKQNSAFAAYNRVLADIHTEFGREQGPTTRELFISELNALANAVYEMRSESSLVNAYFTRGQSAYAGPSIATMNSKYARVNTILYKLNASAREIQELHFQSQMKLVATLQRLASGIVVCLLLLVAGALLYGHRVLRQIERTAQEKDKIAQDLELAKEGAEQATVAKSQFLANMGHDIRTPMNAVLGMLSLIRKTELSPRQADYAGKAEGAARSLLGLLNDILDFTKIEANRLILESRPFDSNQFMCELGAVLAASIGERKVDVLFDIDPALPRHLEGDALRLQQVLINLGANAIKFTERGEVVVAVRVVQQREGSALLEFSVRDTGIGIAPKHQERVFSDFSQAEASITRRYGGTGLGLAICQRLVAAMGGQLQLESSLGVGSKFDFCVELDMCASPAATPKRLLPKEILISRVLIVDDNTTARKLLSSMALSLGWQADVAASRAQAIAMVKSHSDSISSYHAIFVDGEMPDMGGWETSLRLLDLTLGITTPLVFMVTVNGHEALAEKYAAEHEFPCGIVVKPLTTSMMLDAVTQAYSATMHLESSPLPQLATPRRLAGMRLLLVEDNLNNQQVAKELLEDEGAIVLIANHGEEAVDKLVAADSHFDLVLMDMQMPVMDGLAATKLIRSDPGLQKLPIVAMTANAMASDREACLAAGMNDHVGKPFDINQLVSVLCKHTVGHRLPQASANDAYPVLPTTVSVTALAADVDIGTALSRFGGRRGVYQRSLHKLLQDLATMPEELQAHAAHGDTAAVARVLHALKGLAATLGVAALSAEAAAGEESLVGMPTQVQTNVVVQQVCTAVHTANPGLAELLKALQTTQATAITSNAETPPVLDKSALLTALQMMSNQLKCSDMAATHTMLELHKHFGSALSEPLQKIDKAINALDFERALCLCDALANGLTEHQPG